MVNDSGQQLYSGQQVCWPIRKMQKLSIVVMIKDAHFLGLKIPLQSVDTATLFLAGVALPFWVSMYAWSAMQWECWSTEQDTCIVYTVHVHRQCQLCLCGQYILTESNASWVHVQVPCWSKHQMLLWYMMHSAYECLHVPSSQWDESCQICLIFCMVQFSTEGRPAHLAAATDERTPGGTRLLISCGSYKLTHVVQLSCTQLTDSHCCFFFVPSLYRCVT